MTTSAYFGSFAFGLRSKEAVMFDAWKADRGSYLLLMDGCKNGVHREVPVETVVQHWIVNQLKQYQSERRLPHLGWRGKDLKQSYKKLYNELKKLGITRNDLGVTFHGLRHEFCHELMSLHGLTAPVKGGTGNGKSAEQREQILRTVSLAMGHARSRITKTYAGSFANTRYNILPTVTPTPRMIAPTDEGVVVLPIPLKVAS